MGSATRASIAVVIFVALVGFGTIAFVGQEKIAGVFDDFISAISSSLSLPDNAIRNITFDFNSMEYPNTTFALDKKINITIDSSDFTINTATVLNAKSSVNIIGFLGTVIINDIEAGKNITVAGTYESIEIGDVVISTSGSISESSAILKSALLKNIMLKTFFVENTVGTLKLEDTEIKLDNQTMEIYAPIADFFYQEDVEISGRANRIKVLGENTLNINK